VTTKWTFFTSKGLGLAFKEKKFNWWFLTNFGSLNPNLHRNFFFLPSGGSEMGPEVTRAGL
jgi:hypothetical protein